MPLLRSIVNRAKSLPLRAVIIVPFALQLFTAVGVTGYLAYRNGQKAIDDISGQLRNEIVQRIQERLDRYLSTPQVINQLNRTAVELGQLDLDDLPALDRHFVRQVELFSAVSYIYFGSPRGEFSGAGPTNNASTTIGIAGRNGPDARTFYTYAVTATGDRGPLLQSSPDYNVLKRPWYLTGARSDRATWGDAYIWAAPYPILAIPAVLPIQRDGRLLGVFAVDLSLLDLSTFLRTLAVGKTGQTFIIDQRGQLVATSADEDPFITDAPGDLRRLSAENSQNPLIRATVRHLQQMPDGFRAPKTPIQTTFDLDGQRQLVQVAPLRGANMPPWTIAVTIPERDFMARIDANNRNALLLCAIALVVSTGIGILTARWIVYPIRQLSHSALALSSGDWNRTVRLNRHDEIGSLARAFNRMASQLQDSFVSLQTKNAQMQRLDKLKDEFLANTSHELRTPLNGTIGIAESMLDGVAGDLTDLQRYNITLIAQSCHRLNNLVNDILDFSKLRHREVKLQRKGINLRQASNAAINLCHILVSRKNVELINTISPYLPAIYADENRLQQILYNLIGNAIKFTEEGFVSVGAEVLTDGQGDRAVVVTVADTGIGIPEALHDRVFESFEQGDGSTARQYGGTGLGLAVTKQLVALHGGTMTLKSVEGFGSQFSFTLPVARDRPAETAAPVPVLEETTDPDGPINVDPGRPPDANIHPSINASINANGLLTLPPPQALANDPASVEAGTAIGAGTENADRSPQTFHLLLVDDEPVNLQVLVNYLSVSNYMLTQASSGPDAIELLENAPLRPHLVLLDLMMPKMTGYEVIEILRKQYPAHELPIVLLTAKNQPEDIVRGLSLGANDYLTKPINRRELLARIETHLRLSNLTLAYEKFVPHEFLRLLGKKSIVEVKLGDTSQQEMSVLFSDIRNFTRLSEAMTPQDNFQFLNSYLSRIEPAILDNNGFIDKFIGDAVMALFHGSADDAVRSGIGILQRLQDYNTTRQRPDRKPIQIGIGINTGRIVLGTLGGRRRMDTTAISDAVNLAARVEELTKRYGTSLLVTGRTVERLTNPADYHLRLIDRVTVRGKSKPISVFEVFDADEPGGRAAKLATQEQFAYGLTSMDLGQLEAAERAFAACLQRNPNDSVATMLRKRCVAARARQGTLPVEPFHDDI